MNTQRMISTISYNTPSFLSCKLQELTRSHKISDFMFILHYKEEDESKDHIHLWIKPNKRLDTMELQEYFKEPDLDKPGKMLGCIDFRTSEVDEWIPYVLHDSRYLKYKHESRKYSYDKSDMVVYDEMTFEELYRHAYRSSKWNQKMIEFESLVDSDLDGYDLISSGLIDWTQAGHVLSIERLRDRKTYRNGREGHENNKYCQES